MISIFRSLKYVRHNLEPFDGLEGFRWIHVGSVKCGQNQASNEGRKGQKSDSKVDNKETKEYPEEPTTCCMSGCANCVWIEYAEKLSEYYKDGGEQAIKEINEKITDQNLKAFLLHELRMRNLKGK